MGRKKDYMLFKSRKKREDVGRFLCRLVWGGGVSRCGDVCRGIFI
jgi:hypothetical protein